MRRGWMILAALVAALSLATPASAGGWASVRLDEPAGDLVAGSAWKTGLMVRQHDLHAIAVDRVRARATHRESGQTITADATPDGTIGHYALEMTFPEPGSWKWSVTPEPFPTVAMATLNVVAAGDTGATGDTATGGYRVTVAPGGCAEPAAGPAKFSTTVAASKERVLTAEPLALPAELLAATAGPAAVTIATEENGPAVACGAIDPKALVDLTSVALQPVAGAAVAGAALLSRTDDGWSVEVVLVDTAAPATVGGGTTVRITGMSGAWIFEPPLLEIAAGSTVTWVNETEVAHTITGANVAFDDSGMLDPGASFTQTFAEPGTYAYICDPHPGMVGTIAVK